MSKSLKKLIDINRLREFKNKLVGTGSAYVQTGAVDQTVAGTKTFSKPIVGSVTGSSGSCTGNAATATTATTAKSCTGNAATATKLATARSLWGNTFDGSAAIAGAITAPAIELMPAATANHGGFLDFHYNRSETDRTSRIIESSSGTLSINSVTITTGRVVTAKTFNGALEGNVTGNCSGSSGSCTGNAATATKLATARTIALSGAATGTATAFDGSGNITIPVTSLDASKLTGTASVSTTGNAATATTATTAEACTGNAATATKLQTARTINGTGFDGTANITTANWGTARNISITDGTNTSTAVSVDGSANVSLNLPATIKANLTGNCSGSSGSCTGNAATATRATQDAAGNTITTTYATKAENNTKANNSEVVHKSGDETIAGTKTFSNGVLSTAVNAFMAQNKGYTVLLRNDGSNTYLLISDKDGVPGTWSSARPFVISNSTGVCDINGNASTATKLATARTIALSGAATGTATAFDGSGNITIPVTSLDASKLTGTASVSTTGNAATATTATTAQACTGNAATATKLAAKRTIALSGAATGTATGFDGSGNITIPVTALSPSAIRAQWYAAYPDGAEAHNAMWGGRDITAAFNNGTVSEHIADGTFKDIFPGDYITKAVTIYGNGTPGMTYTVNWVIADCDYWINKGDTATTTHHVAIVPQQPIFDANMNATNTTEGGYKGSVMYRSIIRASVTGGIVSAFGSSHILTFRDGITNSVNTSHVSSGLPQLTGTPGWWGEWVSVQCNLMSEKMVYGAPICSAGAMDNSVATRQMSAFRLSERLINYNRQAWWLRDVVSSAYFAYVYGAGIAHARNASVVTGVRPFALLV